MQFIYVLILLLCANGISKEPGTSYEGIYRIKVKELNASGKIEKSKSQLYVQEGKLFSDFSTLNGFSKATFKSSEVAISNNSILIKTMSKNDSGALLKWEVKLEAQTINGWAHRNDTGTTYYFKGKIKK